MKVIIGILALVALAQAFDIDWSTVKPRNVYPNLPITNLTSQHEKIVGGNEASPNSIPYQVFIIVVTDVGNFFCGASLLSRTCVLTAAHCVEGASTIQVTLGAHRANAWEDSQVQVTTSMYTIHEGWNYNTLENDIAIIHLGLAITLNDKIQPVALPSRGETNDFAGEIARISGWGKDSDYASGISPVLRYVLAPVLTNNVCYGTYGGYITDRHICTSGMGGVGSCSGDSGGPLVFNQKQIGIVSFGASVGCEFGYPSAFTRVSKFIDWIEQNSDLDFAE